MLELYSLLAGTGYLPLFASNFLRKEHWKGADNEYSWSMRMNEWLDFCRLVPPRMTATRHYFHFFGAVPDNWFLLCNRPLLRRA